MCFLICILYAFDKCTKDASITDSDIRKVFHVGEIGDKQIKIEDGVIKIDELEIEYECSNIQFKQGKRILKWKCMGYNSQINKKDFMIFSYKRNGKNKIALVDLTIPSGLREF